MNLFYLTLAVFLGNTLSSLAFTGFAVAVRVWDRRNRERILVEKMKAYDEAVARMSVVVAPNKDVN